VSNEDTRAIDWWAEHTCKQCKQIARNDRGTENDWMMNNNGRIQYRWHNYGKQSFSMLICEVGTLIEDPSIDWGNLNWSRAHIDLRNNQLSRSHALIEIPINDLGTETGQQNNLCTRIAKFLQRQRAQIRIHYHMVIWTWLSVHSFVYSEAPHQRSHHIEAHLLAISQPLIKEWSPSIVCSYWSIISATLFATSWNLWRCYNFP